MGLITLLANAATALGRLDGVAATLPNLDLFVAMYVKREAVLSSQIEGTQSSLDDILAFEANPDASQVPDDVEEVVNYIRAMNYGLSRLGALPLSLRLLREIHAELLAGVRGSQKSPGEFRTSQNWIGVGPRGLRDATFVPPPPTELMAQLGDLETFLHQSGDLHPLVVCALAHAQFETIHPFLDGNGRMGRLLITLLLCHERVLHQPLLYLSHYLKLHRSEYYDRLTSVRVAGDWEGWLRFFLIGVGQVAGEAEQTARRIVGLRETTRQQIHDAKMNVKSLALLDHLFQHPVVNVAAVQQFFTISYPSANTLIGGLRDMGLLEEVTGGSRNRMFRFAPYIDLFADPLSDELY